MSEKLLVYFFAGVRIESISKIFSTILGVKMLNVHDAENRQSSTGVAAYRDRFDQAVTFIIIISVST